MNKRGCDYIAFFNDWFWIFWGHIAGALTALYTVHLDDNIICGKETMSVYYVNWTLTTFG